jgi:hypothetical protein
MKISKRKLKTLDIEVTDKGFTIWITERMKRGHIVKHWLIDGSLVKEHGQIQLGCNNYGWRYEAQYDPEERTIHFFDNKI